MNVVNMTFILLNWLRIQIWCLNDCLCSWVTHCALMVGMIIQFMDETEKNNVMDSYLKQRTSFKSPHTFPSTPLQAILCFARVVNPCQLNSFPKAVALRAASDGAAQLRALVSLSLSLVYEEPLPLKYTWFLETSLTRLECGKQKKALLNSIVLMYSDFWSLPSVNTRIAL